MTDLNRAAKAAAVLEAPIFNEAFEIVRTEIINRIERCSLADSVTAEHLRVQLKLLRDVRANLETAINSGRLDAFRLAEDEKRKKHPLRNLFSSAR